MVDRASPDFPDRTTPDLPSRLELQVEDGKTIVLTSEFKSEKPREKWLSEERRENTPPSAQKHLNFDFERCSENTEPVSLPSSSSFNLSEAGCSPSRGSRSQTRLESLSFTWGVEWPSSDESDLDYAPSRNEPSDRVSVCSSGTGTDCGGSDSDFSLFSDSDEESLHCCIMQQQKKQKLDSSDAVCETSADPLPRLEVCSEDDLRDVRPRPTPVAVLHVCSENVTSREVGVYWASHLPLHILVKIFDYVIAKQGCLPFLLYAGDVSAWWARAAAAAVLWRKVDLSNDSLKLTKTKLTSLCQNEFHHVEDLNLVGSHLVNEILALMIKTGCQQLRRIDVSDCHKISTASLLALTEAFPKLTHVKFAGVTHCETVFTTLPQDFEQSFRQENRLAFFIKKLGSRLSHFDLSNSQIRKFQGEILPAVIDSCPRLNYLNLSKVNLRWRDPFVLDIESLQLGCPLLQCLHLESSPLRFSHPAVPRQLSPGFPLLTDFYLCPPIENVLDVPHDLITDDILHRFLHCSKNLIHLGVRHCSHVSIDGLLNLPSQSLKTLLYSLDSRVLPGGGESLKRRDLWKIVRRWGSTVETLEIRHSLEPIPDYNLLCEAFENIVKSRKEECERNPVPLKTLHLNNSDIEILHVLRLLKACPNITTLNLLECKKLPKNLFGKFHGKVPWRMYEGEELETLKREIDKIKKRFNITLPS